MSNRCAIAPVGLMLLALLACKRGESKAEGASSSVAPSAAAASAEPTAASPAAPKDVQGAESPKKAFEQLKKGALGRDYRLFFNALHTESQNGMLVGVLLGSAITLAPIGTKPNPNKKKELDAIFKKHGLEDGPPQIAPGPPEKMSEQIDTALAGVKDRAGLFHDLMLFLEKNSLSEKRVTALALENLKEPGGDTATGKVVMTFENGKTQRKPVEFRKANERWTILIKKWP